MSPVDWAIRPLKRYAQFSGRAPRAEYWWFFLFLVIAYIIAMIIDGAIGRRLVGPYGVVAGLLWLAVIIPTIAVGVRRLHDIDRTGWWMLGPIVPYVIGFAIVGPAMLNPENPPALAAAGAGMIFMLIGFVFAIVVFVFSVLPGTKGPNRFGEDPYAQGNLDEVFA